MLLADRTVLLVDADGVLLDLIAAELNRHGARCFPAQDRATATWGARETLPDVIVCGLTRPGVDAHSLLDELRSAPESAALGAVALHARQPSAAGVPPLADVGSGFQKYLTEPVATADLVDALCCVLGDRTAPARERGEDTELVAELVARHDYRQLLALLNAGTEHRYSAFFRRDGGELHSVWTFDRQRPESDPFTQPLALDATPCAALFDRATPQAGTGTLHSSAAPAECYGMMRSFVGVPLVGLDAIIFGAVCHFSPEPLPVDAAALHRLESVAQLLVPGERRRRPG